MSTPHSFSTPNLSATIVCLCGATVRTDKQGKVSRHPECGLSGKKIKATSIAARKI